MHIPRLAAALPLAVLLGSGVLLAPVAQAATLAEPTSQTADIQTFSGIGGSPEGAHDNAVFIMNNYADQNGVSCVELSTTSHFNPAFHFYQADLVASCSDGGGTN